MRLQGTAHDDGSPDPVLNRSDDSTPSTTPASPAIPPSWLQRSGTLASACDRHQPRAGHNHLLVDIETGYPSVQHFAALLHSCATGVGASSTTKSNNRAPGVNAGGTKAGLRGSARPTRNRASSAMEHRPRADGRATISREPPPAGLIHAGRPKADGKLAMTTRNVVAGAHP